MTLVELSQVKQGVGATGFTADDPLLEQLLATAEAAIGAYLRCDLASEFPEGLPADLEGAVIAFVDLIYNATEGKDYATPASWPFALRFILAHHRRFT